MPYEKPVPFDLNRDAGIRRLTSGTPLVAAAALVTAVLWILLSTRAAAGELPRPVDLNTATAIELVELPGIGKTRAEAIIRFRETRAFKRPSDIMRVRGIGRRTYLKLKPYLRVGPDTARQASEAPPTPGAPSS